MNKVVIVNQTTNYLTIDIVNAYTEKYDVVVLMAGSIDEFERKLHKSVIISKILRYNKANIFYRMSTWLFATLQIFFKLLFEFRTYHIIYVTNPPLSYFSSLILRNSYSIIIYDIYPDALLNVGMTDSNIIFKIWKTINSRIFMKATKLYTLSSGMSNLISKYCIGKEITVIPNWRASEHLCPIDKLINPFILKYNLLDKFVVMYSGNIGYTHCVEIIIDIAEHLRNEKQICFFIIGDGLKKKELMKKVAEKELNQCYFLPLLPANEIRYSLSAADLSIITLTEETAFVSVPSKTYNLLSVGSPLMCIAPLESEIGRLVNDVGCGKCFEKKQIRDMVTYILKLKNNEKYKMLLSNNALEASTNYKYENARLYVS